MSDKKTSKVGLALSIMEFNCLIHVLFCMYCLDFIERQPSWFYFIAACGMAYYLISGIMNALGAARVMEIEDQKNNRKK